MDNRSDLNKSNNTQDVKAYTQNKQNSRSYNLNNGRNANNSQNSNGQNSNNQSSNRAQNTND